MTDLLPCPFCGRSDTGIGLDETKRYRQAECGWCGATGPGARIADANWTMSRPDLMEAVDAKAAERWNTRPSPWIPCAERMPELQTVCIISNGKFVAAAYPFMLDRGYAESITHWMPLPEPPEVEP